MFLCNKFLIVYEPGTFIPHLKKKRKQLSTGPAPGAEAVINVRNHVTATLL